MLRQNFKRGSGSRRSSFVRTPHTASSSLVHSRCKTNPHHPHSNHTPHHASFHHRPAPHHRVTSKTSNGSARGRGNTSSTCAVFAKRVSTTRVRVEQLTLTGWNAVGRYSSGSVRTCFMQCVSKSG